MCWVKTIFMLRKFASPNSIGNIIEIAKVDFLVVHLDMSRPFPSFPILMNSDNAARIVGRSLRIAIIFSPRHVS